MYTQTSATTQSEQTLVVPIEAPPFNRLRVKYNILKGQDDEKEMKKGRLFEVLLAQKSFYCLSNLSQLSQLSRL